MATERSNIYEGSITLVKIKDGTSGDVITIVGTAVEYALGSNGTVSPTSGWGSAIPEPTDEKRFLWTRSTVKYSDNTKLVSYSVSYMAKDGADGKDGDNGEDGEDGQNGTSVTVTEQKVDYYQSEEATAPDINNDDIWSDMPGSLKLGTYLWARSTVTYSDKTVTRTIMVSYIGTNGENGQPGRDGVDGQAGQTFYTWIKYSNSSDPQTAADMTDDPAGQSYIGIAYNQLEVTESNDPKDYAWAQIKGPQGEPGAGVTIEQQSITYQIGDSGTEPPSGTWLDAIPELSGHSERFLWTKTEITYNVEGKNTVSYSVSYIAKNGADGSDGNDGTTYYTWIKYCDDPEGENPVLSDEPQDYKYMGVAHNQTSPTESNNVNDYKWSLIRGMDGTNGENGAPGTSVTIDSQMVEYVVSTSPTDQPGEGAGWTTYIPTNFTNGDYLWTRTTVIYSDGKKTVAYGVSYLGVDGTNGDPGASAPPVQAQYSPDGVTNWLDTFTVGVHKYIRFSYDGGETWTAGIKIVGEDSNATAYFIETNQEEIKRFVTSENGDGVKTYELSPATLEFSVYNMPYTSASGSIDFSQLNFSLAYIQTGTTHPLSPNDIEAYTYFGSYAEGSDASQILDQSRLFFDLKDYLTSIGLIAEDLVIKFSLLDGNGAEIAIKLLPLSNGVNADMATFNLHATGFHAAMQKTSLNFSEKGLSLKNGDFEIVGEAQFEEIGKIDSFKPGQTYYYLNSENEYIVATQYDSTKTYYIRTPERLLYSEGGNLVLKGTIIAKSGEFSGEVNASGGSIGGFDIEEQILSSFSKEPDGTASIILDGTNGTITAQRINLGAEAKIMDKIVFAGKNDKDTAWIFNPQKHSGTFIKAGLRFEIQSNGIMNLGDIKMDGPNSTISGNNFSITPKMATFSNISCGGKITSVVFEKNKIQAVGGSMIYKPSYKVYERRKTLESIDVRLEDESEFDAGNKGDLVWLIDINGEKIDDAEYTVTAVSEDRKEITISPATPANRTVTTLILIGLPEDIIIGLNSLESAVYGKIYGQGLTMQTYNNTELPEVFLGNLSQLGTAYSGYGLYSQNVYLNGSLTTKVDEDSYAGVNTLSGVNANIFGTGEKDDQSKIVFWAGSDSPEAEDIRIAPFQVTEKGSVYASQARISNSLFAGGSIIGSDIYAARIHGCDPSNEADPTAPAALTIYDSKVGISFKSGYGGEEKESFSINNSGFVRNQQSFIELNDEVVFIGSAFRTGTTERHLALSQSQINFMSISEGAGSIYSQVAFSEDTIGFSIGNTKQVSISKGATSIFTTLQATGYVHFGENDNYMEYQRQDTGGYDLFISHN